MGERLLTAHFNYLLPGWLGQEQQSFSLVQSQSQKSFSLTSPGKADAFDAFEFACQRRITFSLARFNKCWGTLYIYVIHANMPAFGVCLLSETPPPWAMCNSFMLVNSYLQLPATCNCLFQIAIFVCRQRWSGPLSCCF